MRKATPDQVEDLRKVERPQRRGKHWGHKSRQVYHWGTIRRANAEPSDWFLQRLVFPDPLPAFAPIQAHDLTRLAVQNPIHKGRGRAA